MAKARRARRKRLRTFVVGFALLLFLLAVVLLIRLQELPPPSIDAAQLAEAAYSPPAWVGDLAERDLGEISGLARSHRVAERMWAVNDGGNAGRLYAIGLHGEDHGSIRLRHVENDDWEALASYELDGDPYLLIADVGDNLSRKKKRRLHAVREPTFESGAAPKKIDVLWTLEFRYDDGPRDCEAVAVDAARREILLLTKRDLPARLYVLELPGKKGPQSAKTVVARFSTEVFNIPQPTAEEASDRFPFGAWLAQPTALDVEPDGSAALVLTYGNVYRFAKAPSESWRAAFRRIPERVRIPALRQAEALGFVPGGASFMLTSEKRPAPLYRYDPLPR
jgi:hypothetical protein